MPCVHKFQSELNLDLLNYEPTTLIVGTFIPAWPANSYQWFYGRTDNNYFWNVLPRLYGNEPLQSAPPAQWKHFCKDKQIALTDLINCIDDADAGNKEHSKILSGNSDKAIAYHFDDFEFVNIVQLLQHHPSIRNVYLTRSVTEAFWKHIWNPVMQYCNKHGIRERKLITPSTESAHQNTTYNEQHPTNQIDLLEDYILMKWQQEWQQ